MTSKCAQNKTIKNQKKENEKSVTEMKKIKVFLNNHRSTTNGDIKIIMSDI